MGRDACKARGNVWYEARLRAAKYDDRLSSREKAGDLLGISLSSMADIELNNLKVMPVDKAVLMADLYKAPELLNYYCLHECPIGCELSISDKLCNLDRVTIKLGNLLNSEFVDKAMKRLNQIADDGKVSGWEMETFNKIVDYLDKIAKGISEVKLLAKSMRMQTDEE